MKKHTLTIAALAAVSALATNPITPEGEFLSDPAPRTGPDGALYVFGSRDERTAGGAYCTHFNDVFETRDLRAWTARRGVLASTGENDGVPASDAPLYAPDAIFHNGKWRIFYCMPDKSHREGVASADTPSGPFKASFSYPWATQIDPSVFRDDDGTMYYFWGQFSAKGAVLKPDLSGIEPGTLHTGVIDEARHNFHEGIQLTKRGGVYYLVFADVSRHGRPTCIGYATAANVFGPYTYRGVIIDNYGCDPNTWNNHGGIVEFNGRWYVLYHRS
ncbi:MAG: family 43 glycosylhydrolase, partial [Kiritimatiellae bacterium]|nr:family 43 glycosylhydrolase [Kiritimatiellia bacterium]